jgi:hypothetical protein
MNPEVRILSWKMLFFRHFVNCLPLRHRPIYIYSTDKVSTNSGLTPFGPCRTSILITLYGCIHYSHFSGYQPWFLFDLLFQGIGVRSLWSARVTSIHTLTPRPQSDPRSDDTIRHMIVMCALHEMTGYQG